MLYIGKMNKILIFFFFIILFYNSIWILRFHLKIIDYYKYKYCKILVKKIEKKMSILIVINCMKMINVSSWVILIPKKLKYKHVKIK